MTERDNFEAWYVEDANATCNLNMKVEDVKRLRTGNAYGGRVALNSKWEGWQARASWVNK